MEGGGGTRGINLSISDSIRPGISPSAGPLGHTKVDVWQGTHCTGKTGKMVTKIPWQGKHREFKNESGLLREFGFLKL